MENSLIRGRITGQTSIRRPETRQGFVVFFLRSRGQILDNATLATLILINQRQRNTAIGIANDPQFLRGMASFIRSKSEVQSKAIAGRLAEAVFLKTMIEEHQALATQLTDYIMDNIEDDDIRNEGVYAMTKLEAYVNRLGEQLEVLWLHW